MHTTASADVDQKKGKFTVTAYNGFGRVVLEVIGYLELHV